MFPERILDFLIYKTVAHFKLEGLVEKLFQGLRKPNGENTVSVDWASVPFDMTCMSHEPLNNEQFPADSMQLCESRMILLAKLNQHNKPNM